ncbi:MAG: DUF4209 domain-containing protein [Azoarcus sp.]|nr:DUF4209 domain-containing protein [Azoarcus sp.]
MTSERYPADLIVTAQDFAESGWEAVLGKATRDGYISMSPAFSAAAREAMEAGQEKHGKVLWLLAYACSMMLSPSSLNEPFKPYADFLGCRSVIPDDLADADIQFYSEIVDLVDDAWLKARLADLVWLKQAPRNPAFALKAIDAYRSIPLDTETCLHGGRECWERAIQLALMLGAGADARLEDMETSFLALLDSAKTDDGNLALWLANLLKKNKLAKSNRSCIAQKLEGLARDFAGKGGLLSARNFFSVSADWYELDQNKTKATEMTVEVAEGYAKEATANTLAGNPSHMTAAHFYEKAIQTYRTIPNNQRDSYRVNERIDELHAQLDDAGEKTLSEMKVTETQEIDITKLVDGARNSVSGKTANDALFSFVNLCSIGKVDEQRNSALMLINQSFLTNFFSATVFSQDGRVIAKRPSMIEDKEMTVHMEMIRGYTTRVNIVSCGYIMPALEVLLLEHRLCEADFVNLAKQSPLIPIERAGLFGKALFAGYDRNFVTALHLLIPQIEHMVRVHLKNAGAKTTHLDVNGIETENGLSTLIDLPEAEQIFGKDLVFEFKALFCDGFGPNLRNQLAHGLLDEGACFSPPVVYAWWLALKIVFNTWWNAVYKNPTEEVDAVE